MNIEVPFALQRKFWNEWNANSRELGLDKVSKEQAEWVCRQLDSLALKNPDIIEIGCGAGWLSARLASFGRVLATDLADEVVARAARRYPKVDFVAGDFMRQDFGAAAFDVAVSLEVLSHIADQRAFLEKIAGHLRPGGYVILATQNRPALRRNNVPPPAPGQLRHWVDRHELRELLHRQFELIEMQSITPIFNRGWLRLVNSYKLHHAARTVAPPLARWVKSAQEKAWLGWTLMALARKR